MILTRRKKLILPTQYSQRGSILLSGFGVQLGSSSGPVYTLSGTTGTPNIASDAQTSPTNAQAGWTFRTDGTVDEEEGAANFTQFQDGVEWTDEQDTPTVDIWIRAQNDAGDNPTTGPSLNTWHVLQGSGEADRQWRWIEITDGFASTSGTLQIDISTDSGGSTIVATGYYRGVASTEL